MEKSKAGEAVLYFHIELLFKKHPPPKIHWSLLSQLQQEFSSFQAKLTCKLEGKVVA